MPPIIHSHWHRLFDTPFQAMDFYQRVNQLLAEKGIKHVEVSNITYSQGGLLSPNRQYLRIKYHDYVFDICAAPFGTQYFVSWWLGELGNPIRDFFINLPIIGKLFSRRKKTFYELDTEIMFKETVSYCVREIVDENRQSQGLRALADSEWNAYNRLY